MLSFLETGDSKSAVGNKGERMKELSAIGSLRLCGVVLGQRLRGDVPLDSIVGMLREWVVQRRL